MPTRKKPEVETPTETTAKTRSRRTTKPAEPEPTPAAEPLEDKPRAGRRGRAAAKTAPEPEPVEAPEAEPAARRTRARKEVEAPVANPEPPVEEKPARRASSRRKKPEEPSATPEPKAEPARDEDAKPVRRARSTSERRDSEPELADAIQWRPRSQEPSAPKEEPAEVVESAAGEATLAPRRSRTKRRRDRQEAPITAEVVAKPTPAPKLQAARPKREAPKPEAPKTETRKRREPVPIPDDAARVVSRDGVPVIVRHKTVFPPVCFFASAQDESHFATVLEEVKLASEQGIHLFSLLVELEVDRRASNDAVAAALYLVKKVSAVDPEAQILLRTVLVAPSGWEDRFPRARYLSEDGGVADPSICDDQFWEEAETCVRDFVAKVSKLDTGGNVLGLHLERGEWFISSANGYDTSIAAQEGFRTWLRHRYREDAVTLRASWFDGQVQFETVGVPEEQDLRRSEHAFVRTDRKARPWVDYHLYLSDSTCDRITQLAYTVKAASEGRYLVGVSYGYTFEWSHPHSGHLSLGKVLRSPDIDYIAGPPSYRNREPGGSAPFPGPIDSIALNGKLYISEEDFKTPISGRREPDDFNPVMKTPQALESVHWRGIGSALAHCAGICWMDTWGNGWLNSLGIWERAGRATTALTWRLAAPFEAPDVAVFIDERSLAYLIDPLAFEALVQNVRESVLRSGLSVGFYLLSDLAHRENFPDSKLYVFTNAWDIRPEVRSAIKTRLQRDGKVLFWMYAAGLFEGGRESLERVREVTGIALRPQPFNSKTGTTILNFRDPLCQGLPDKAMTAGGQLEPSYFAIPEDGRVLGEYSATGLPSFVVRHFEENWTSVFLGEPIVSPGLFRALGQLAGAHVWSFADDVVHVRPPFLTVHCTGTGLRTVALPEKWAAYSLNTGEWMPTESNSLHFHALDGASHSFVVGLRGEVEHLIANDPAELLRMEVPPPKRDDTLHWEAVSFDIAIMKLDEWVEESWGDDLADDLLLKPSLLDPEEEPDEDDDAGDGRQRSRGRRRRRRRRGVNGHGSEEVATARREGADRARDSESMNVVFRKRE
ncbi:MAG: hypothetical protein KIT11_11695 [Fimbriimonadaceae bacterium]|nr:hypothetical protein [Fimbriimonadaceae bacterium]QYK55303.1 MAG: hypothetical protein KF733_09840 [Fimbriimonadaceae bacterium]